MVTQHSNAELLLAQQTAEKYRREGFEVQMDWPLDFVPGFRADLLARKDNRTKVIGVKSRSTLEASPQIVEAAKMIDSRPGWQFELMLVLEPEQLTGPPMFRSIDEASISNRLEEARRMLEQGHSEAAMILAWSACEAVIRKLVADAGVVDSRITTANYLFERATYLGVLDRVDYHRLAELQKFRNAFVHGFSHESPSDEVAIELIETAERLSGATDLEERPR